MGSNLRAKGLMTDSERNQYEHLNTCMRQAMDNLDIGGAHEALTAMDAILKDAGNRWTPLYCSSGPVYDASVEAAIDILATAGGEPDAPACDLIDPESEIGGELQSFLMAAYQRAMQDVCSVMEQVDAAQWPPELDWIQSQVFDLNVEPEKELSEDDQILREELLSDYNNLKELEADGTINQTQVCDLNGVEHALVEYGWHPNQPPARMKHDSPIGCNSPDGCEHPAGT